MIRIYCRIKPKFVGFVSVALVSVGVNILTDGHGHKISIAQLGGLMLILSGYFLYSTSEHMDELNRIASILMQDVALSKHVPIKHDIVVKTMSDRCAVGLDSIERRIFELSLGILLMMVGSAASVC